MTPQQSPLQIGLQIVQALGPYVGLAAALIGAAYLLRRGRLDARNAFAAEIFKFRLKQVEDFYAPALLDVEQSKRVYDKLIWMLNTNKAVDMTDFRLLDHIFSFSTEPKFADYMPLVDEILKIGQHLTQLISDHAGLIEGGVTDTFVQYSAHFNILTAAARQRLSETAIAGSNKFGYYPRILNREIREGYKIVLEQIRSHIASGDRIIAELTNDPLFGDRARMALHRFEMLETLRYYEQNAKSYAEKFDGFDLSAKRQRLLTEIRSKNWNRDPFRILDVGAGSGRDLRAFMDAGCVVVGLDASPAMVRQCKRKIREARDSHDAQLQQVANESDCLELSFDEIEFVNQFDGVWAAASLLHVPNIQLLDIVRRLVKSLKTNGVCYLSLKLGSGENQRHGRFFSYYNVFQMRGLLREIEDAQEIAIWLSKPTGDDLRKHEEIWAWTKSLFGIYDRSLWMNVLARRKPL